MAELKALTALNQRVWYVEGGVHPTRSPVFLALGKFGEDPSQTFGESKRITAPDPNNFNNDITVGTVEGSKERAKLGVAVRSTAQQSILLGWGNRGCRVDIFALSGRCGNPQDFTDGGEKWEYFPDGKISDFKYSNFGSYDKADNNPTEEAVTMTAEEILEFLYMRQEQIGAASTVREILTADVWKGDNCEDCPNPTNRVILTMAGVGATPGTVPSVLYSSDGGETFTAQDISTLFANETINDSAIIGADFVIISNTAREIHYTDLAALYGAYNTWQQVNTGFVVGKGPKAITSADVRHTWIVGDGGYIYFAKNHRVGVEVQDAGVITTQNWNDVHAKDANNVVAVGNSNAIARTYNGGLNWESVTGPAVGVNLATVWMWSADVWFVGEGAGGTGKLWLTSDGGKTWSQVGLPASYSRIYDMEFCSEAEGYMIASTGTQSVVLRTITAGNEWTTLPNGKKGVALNNTYLTHVTVTNRFSNTAYASGLAANGTAGIAFKFSA